MCKQSFGAIKNGAILALRGRLAHMASKLPFSFMPRNRLVTAEEVCNGHPFLHSMHLASSDCVVPELSEPFRGEFYAQLTKGQMTTEAYIPARHAFKIDNASVLMPECLVIKAGHIIIETSPTLSYFDTANFLRSYFVPRHSLNLSNQTAFLLGMPFQKNYHLWLQYALPRLMFWEFLPSETRKDIPVLISDDSPKFILDALLWYQLKHPDLQFKPISRSKTFVQALWVAEPMSVNDLPNPRAVAWLRSTFMSGLPKQSKRRLFISRKGALERDIINEPVLIELLKTFGFESFDPGRHSFREQVSAFANSEIIVAPHGAALSNLAFAPSSTHVIELIGGSHFYSCFRFLSSIVGINYLPVLMKSNGVHMEADQASLSRISALITSIA